MSNLIERIDKAITELEEIRTLLLAIDDEQADATWADDIAHVMRSGNKMELSAIYRGVKERRLEARRSWPREGESAVRVYLQTQRCFRNVERGVWQLRK